MHFFHKNESIKGIYFNEYMPGRGSILYAWHFLSNILCTTGVTQYTKSQIIETFENLNYIYKLITLSRHLLVHLISLCHT